MQQLEFRQIQKQILGCPQLHKETKYIYTTQTAVQIMWDFLC
jgi:hypothetical protein